MKNENLSNIWPILYFKADWPSNSYNFDLGVKIIKADESILDKDARIDDFGSNVGGLEDFIENTDWLLVVRYIEVDKHISVNKKDMSFFIDSLEQAIKESFLMSLQLVRSTEAICPFRFLGKLSEDCIEDLNNPEGSFLWKSEGGRLMINSDRPPVYLPETFEIGDLQILTDLWSAIIKLRNLDFSKKQINTEEFFAACDKEASKNAEKKEDDFFMALGCSEDVSEEERKRGGFRKDFYKDSIQNVFLEKQEELFSNRTRIGRALNLFFEGLRLPLQHSFLSMCLVLETLFTVDEGETTHKLTTRLAKMIGSRGANGKEERKEMHKRAKKIYDERSNIVHGDKLIDAKNTEVLKDTFLFARQGLQRILLDPKLLALYSDPGTTDKKVKGKLKEDARNAIREYFLDLDLQCY